MLPELEAPEDFESATQDFQPNELRSKIRVSSDLKQNAAWIQEYIELGLKYLSSSNR